MNFLRAFYESQWWIPMIALCALAVTFALMRNISQQDKPLPKPRMDCIDRGPLEHWEAEDGHVRHP